jgi:hypothetical protein
MRRKRARGTGRVVCPGGEIHLGEVARADWGIVATAMV